MTPNGNKAIVAVNGGRIYMNNQPLPVEIELVQAYVESNFVKLYWKTLTEINNYGFEIEEKEINEKIQNSKWEKIGFVKGNGNSNCVKEYSFIDKTAKTGTTFYRIKQIDNDGGYKYSKVVEVKIMSPKDFLAYKNYPNPFNPTTTICYAIPTPGNVSVKVYDNLGQEVAVLFEGNQGAGRKVLNFDASNLTSGIYYCKIKYGGEYKIVKMTLMK